MPVVCTAAAALAKQHGLAKASQHSCMVLGGMQGVRCLSGAHPYDACPGLSRTAERGC